MSLYEVAEFTVEISSDGLELFQGHQTQKLYLQSNLPASIKFGSSRKPQGGRCPALGCRSQRSNLREADLFPNPERQELCCFKRIYVYFCPLNVTNHFLLSGFSVPNFFSPDG